mmetsp:Transcript_13610/g.22663  ORF Transcript_13610/g.22663 Transcript_13610/m.22663 type:complete len:393 (-) Transcript_13610:305-1483(-)
MDYSYGHTFGEEHPWYGADGAGEWRGRKAKRKRKQHVTAVAPPPALDLTLKGTACRVTQDDAFAERIEKGFHLINYFEDRFVLSDDEESDDGCIVHRDGDMAMADCASTSANADRADGKNVRNHTDNRTRCRALYMDRYDARMLIDDYSTLCRRWARRTSNYNSADCDVADSGRGRMPPLESIDVRDKEDGLTKQQIDEINFDRFGALPEYREIFLDDADNDCSKSGAGDQDGHNVKKAVEQDEEPLTLTEEEAKYIPTGMVLPTSKRQNGIIQLTAERAATQSQFEVLLKVKQAGNRDFAFLSLGNELHPYYSWLKGRGGAIVRERSASGSSSSSSDMKDGLGGLLAGYGSSSSGSTGSDEENPTDGVKRETKNEATTSSAGGQGTAGDDG